MQFSIGAGSGEYEIDTTRRDLGSDNTIKASDITADVSYFHVGLSGELNRGKLSIRPRVSYRSFDLDLPQFFDIVPDDANTMANNSVGN